MKSQQIWSRILVLVCALSLCNISFAQDSSEYSVEENPGAIAMTVDLVAVRPVMLATTIVGSALWVVSLPFTAAGGNVKAAADTLVVTPAKTTFVRCLGCTQLGYKE